MRPHRWSLLLVLVSTLAQASSLRARDVPERTADADRVVLVEVLGSVVQVPDGDVHRMTTLTTVVVLEDYKGHGPRQVEISQLGGESGLWKLKVTGGVEWVPGETAVLFLRCRDAAHPERCTVEGLREGKISVVGKVGEQDAIVTGDVHRGPVRLRLEELADRVKLALKRGER